jgi:DNA invertase Pin-like site-specific DNA recombinase
MYNEIKNMAGYCRVSTDDADQLHSLSAQIKYFTEYISQQPNCRLKEVYYDEGITGTSTKKRDGFNRMITDAENGKIDVILTKEVSRFARNTVDTLSYTRKLSNLGVGVIFTNDGIDTRDKDGELRLTIMASIAQEESRKTSERVKWGLRRKTENGWVLGTSRMFGFKIENGVISIVPEEAEIIRRIFHSYAYERKGFQNIAKELNADGIFTINGKIWTGDSVSKVIKNDKYSGDLTQFKYVIVDFLTKERRKNDGEVPFVHIPNHHEAIVDRETFDKAQEQTKARAMLPREGRKHTGAYWFSGKVVCGICGRTYCITGNRKARNRGLYCVNRLRFGKEKRTDKTGEEVGCKNRGLNELVLSHCVGYLLEHIQNAREEIISDLLLEIKEMQKEAEVVDIKKFEDEIENINNKKRKAIDAMLEGLISKADLKQQTSFYENEVVRLNTEISKNQNINYVHETQINKVKEYIDKVKKAAKVTDYNTDIFAELTERVVVHDDNCTVDFYLNCVPFGFRINYHTKLTGQRERTFHAIVDKCTIIND